MFSDIIAFLVTPQFLSSTIMLATPLLIASMGGILSERCGVLFLGIEGFMLIGAFFSFLGGYHYGPWAGLASAVIVCSLFGFLYAFCAVTLAMNQVVLAVAFNLFALGVTSAFIRTLFGVSTSHLECTFFKAAHIPVLADIPYLGVLFQRTGFTYIGYILVPIVFIIFYKTNWGLKIRAVGENPMAAETTGVKVSRVQYFCVVWASIFAGIGGASTTIGDIGLFVDNMIAGRGFIAFTAIILGRFNPIGAMIAVLFFGFIDAFQLNLQAMGSVIPYQFPLMMPYVLTLFAFLVAGSGVAPKHWGYPYVSEVE